MDSSLDNGMVFDDYCVRTKVAHAAPLGPCTGETKRAGTTPDLREMQRRCPSCGRPIWQASLYSVNDATIEALAEAHRRSLGE